MLRLDPAENPEHYLLDHVRRWAKGTSEDRLSAMARSDNRHHGMDRSEAFWNNDISHPNLKAAPSGSCTGTLAPRERHKINLTIRSQHQRHRQEH